MARDAQESQKKAANSSPPGPDSEKKPQEVIDLLAKVEGLLKQEQPAKALELIRRSKVNSPWAVNAMGVCLLRVGDVQGAIGMFRGLVLGTGLSLKQDVPAVFKTNFAIALLLTDNVTGCLSTLDDLHDEQNVAVQRLRDAIRHWKESLSAWQKLQWYLGGQPARKVQLDFAPGDL